MTLTLTTFALSSIDVPHGDQLGKCRSISDFERLNQIGAGTFGDVYRSRDKASNEVVAIKRLRKDKEEEGISRYVVREIELLMSLKHENVVQLKEVTIGRDGVALFLVMEYCEHDLAELVDCRKTPFTVPEVKCIVMQLLRGLLFLHNHFVVHRDLKVPNLFLTDQGILKIGDFGLARRYSIPLKPMTPEVVTLWYRAPELLLRSPEQTTAIDMWACGCVLGELLLHKPLLQGSSEVNQLNLIIDLLGTPNDAIWPGLSSLPAMQHMTLREQPYNNLKTKFNWMSDAGIRLLNFVFMYDPRQRATASECLQSLFFRESPLPCSPADLPVHPQHRSSGSDP